MEELLRNISQGRWGPHRAIQQKNFSQGQIRIIPFEDYVQSECRKSGVNPISLYHTAQGQINKDMLERLGRSSIFRDKVKGLVCDEWGHCTVSDMFEDNVTDPFDYNECGKERAASESIQGQLRGISDSFHKEDPDLRSKLMTLQGECVGCLDRIKGHQSKLGENYEQYQPNYPDVWANLAMKNGSFYHDQPGTEANRDEKTDKFIQKQIKRVIPEDINEIFMNASLLPTLMRKENKQISNELTEISDSLKSDLSKLSDLIHNLPESPEKEETEGFFATLLGKMGIEMGDSSSSEDEGGGEDIPSLIAGLTKDSSGEEDEDEEGEEDEGPEGDGPADDEGPGTKEGDGSPQQSGGKNKDRMYHLAFY